MAKSDRFQIVQEEGTGEQDRVGHSGYAGGLCPLLDKDGKPLTWET